MPLTCHSAIVHRLCAIFFLLILFYSDAGSIQPSTGSVIINSDFGAAVMWDGFALQERQIAKKLDLNIQVLDSIGRQLDSGGLEYVHLELGPTVDIAIYLLPRIAIGGGYSYAWAEQLIDADYILKDDPGARRLFSIHQIRGQLIITVHARKLDMIDVVAVPFYFTGNLTRAPLPLVIYRNIVDADGLALLKAINEPVSCKGYGGELRIRSRHFVNKYIFVNGSIYYRVQDLETVNDPFIDELSNWPQKTIGITLGLGIMFGPRKDLP